MLRIFLIRHGEALGQGRYMGLRTNPVLSEDGRAQVRDLKSILPVTGKDCRISSSPMHRAVETAGLLFDNARNAFDLTVMDEFSEIDFGEWDGLSWQEISNMADAQYRSWIDDPVALSPPGGESLTGFNRRVGKGLNAVIDDCLKDGIEDVYIATHGGVIRSILCSVLELSADKHWSFKIDLASVSCVNIFPNSPGGRLSGIDFLNLKAY
jgi:broad specificity phosphatase PhoE